MVPLECVKRVVRVNGADDFASGFTIDRHGSQWLITAAHVVADHTSDTIDLETVDGTVTVRARRVAPPPDATADITTADIAVFQLEEPVTENTSVDATGGGAVISQDVYFLGYPHGLQLHHGRPRSAFIKKAILSAQVEAPSGAVVWYLDGLNNPGFSGGPVVFQDARTSRWNIGAVVSGHYIEHAPANDGSDATVSRNSGIIVTYRVDPALLIIDGA